MATSCSRLQPSVKTSTPWNVPNSGPYTAPSLGRTESNRYPTAAQMLGCADLEILRFQERADYVGSGNFCLPHNG